MESKADSKGSFRAADAGRNVRHPPMERRPTASTELRSKSSFAADDTSNAGLPITDSHTLARAMLARHEERSVFEDERKLSDLQKQQLSTPGAGADPFAMIQSAVNKSNARASMVPYEPLGAFGSASSGTSGNRGFIIGGRGAGVAGADEDDQQSFDSSVSSVSSGFSLPDSGLEVARHLRLAAEAEAAAARLGASIQEVAEFRRELLDAAGAPPNVARRLAVVTSALVRRGSDASEANRALARAVSRLSRGVAGSEQVARLVGECDRRGAERDAARLRCLDAERRVRVLAAALQRWRGDLASFRWYRVITKALARHTLRVCNARLTRLQARAQRHQKFAAHLRQRLKTARRVIEAAAEADTTGVVSTSAAAVMASGGVGLTPAMIDAIARASARAAFHSGGAMGSSSGRSGGLAGLGGVTSAGGVTRAALGLDGGLGSGVGIVGGTMGRARRSSTRSMRGGGGGGGGGGGAGSPARHSFAATRNASGTISGALHGGDRAVAGGSVGRPHRQSMHSTASRRSRGSRRSSTRNRKGRKIGRKPSVRWAGDGVTSDDGSASGSGTGSEGGRRGQEDDDDDDDDDSVDGDDIARMIRSIARQQEQRYGGVRRSSGRARGGGGGSHSRSKSKSNGGSSGKHAGSGDTGDEDEDANSDEDEDEDADSFDDGPTPLRPMGGGRKARQAAIEGVLQALSSAMPGQMQEAMGHATPKGSRGNVRQGSSSSFGLSRRDRQPGGPGGAGTPRSMKGKKGSEYLMVPKGHSSLGATPRGSGGGGGGVTRGMVGQEPSFRDDGSPGASHGGAAPQIPMEALRVAAEAAVKAAMESVGVGYGKALPFGTKYKSLRKGKGKGRSKSKGGSRVKGSSAARSMAGTVPATSSVERFQRDVLQRGGSKAAIKHVIRAAKSRLDTVGRNGMSRRRGSLPSNLAVAMPLGLPDEDDSILADIVGIRTDDGDPDAELAMRGDQAAAARIASRLGVGQKGSIAYQIASGSHAATARRQARQARAALRRARSGAHSSYARRRSISVMPTEDVLPGLRGPGGSGESAGAAADEDSSRGAMDGMGSPSADGRSYRPASAASTSSNASHSSHASRASRASSRASAAGGRSRRSGRRHGGNTVDGGKGTGKGIGKGKGKGGPVDRVARSGRALVTGTHDKGLVVMGSGVSGGTDGDGGERRHSVVSVESMHRSGIAGRKSSIDAGRPSSGTVRRVASASAAVKMNDAVSGDSVGGDVTAMEAGSGDIGGLTSSSSAGSLAEKRVLRREAERYHAWMGREASLLRAHVGLSRGLGTDRWGDGDSDDEAEAADLALALVQRDRRRARHGASSRLLPELDRAIGAVAVESAALGPSSGSGGSGNDSLAAHSVGGGDDGGQSTGGSLRLGSSTMGAGSSGSSSGSPIGLHIGVGTEGEDHTGEGNAGGEEEEWARVAERLGLPPPLQVADILPARSVDGGAGDGGVGPHGKLTLEAARDLVQNDPAKAWRMGRGGPHGLSPQETAAALQRRLLSMQARSDWSGAHAGKGQHRALPSKGASGPGSAAGAGAGAGALVPSKIGSGYIAPRQGQDRVSPRVRLMHPSDSSQSIGGFSAVVPSVEGSPMASASSGGGWSYADDDEEQERARMYAVEGLSAIESPIGMGGRPSEHSSPSEAGKSPGSHGSVDGSTRDLTDGTTSKQQGSTEAAGGAGHGGAGHEVVDGTAGTPGAKSAVVEEAAAGAQAQTTATATATATKPTDGRKPTGASTQLRADPTLKELPVLGAPHDSAQYHQSPAVQRTYVQTRHRHVYDRYYASSATRGVRIARGVVRTGGSQGRGANVRQEGSSRASYSSIEVKGRLLPPPPPPTFFARQFMAAAGAPDGEPNAYGGDGQQPDGSTRHTAAAHGSLAPSHADPMTNASLVTPRLYVTGAAPSNSPQHAQAVASSKPSGGKTGQEGRGRGQPTVQRSSASKPGMGEGPIDYGSLAYEDRLIEAAVLALQRQEVAINVYWRHAMQQRDAQWQAHMQTEIARSVAEALLSHGVQFTAAWHEGRAAAFGEEAAASIESGSAMHLAAAGSGMAPGGIPRDFGAVHGGADPPSGSGSTRGSYTGLDPPVPSYHPPDTSAQRDASAWRLGVQGSDSYQSLRGGHAQSRGGMYPTGGQPTGGVGQSSGSFATAHSTGGVGGDIPPHLPPGVMLDPTQYGAYHGRHTRHIRQVSGSGLVDASMQVQSLSTPRGTSTRAPPYWGHGVQGQGQGHRQDHLAAQGAQPGPSVTQRSGLLSSRSAPDLLDLESYTHAYRRQAAGANPGDVVAVPGVLSRTSGGYNDVTSRDSGSFVGREVLAAFQGGQTGIAGERQSTGGSGGAGDQRQTRRGGRGPAVVFGIAGREPFSRRRRVEGESSVRFAEHLQQPQQQQRQPGISQGGRWQSGQPSPSLEQLHAMQFRLSDGRFRMTDRRRARSSSPRQRGRGRGSGGLAAAGSDLSGSAGAPRNWPWHVTDDHRGAASDSRRQSSAELRVRGAPAASLSHEEAAQVRWQQSGGGRPIQDPGRSSGFLRQRGPGLAPEGVLPRQERVHEVTLPRSDSGHALPPQPGNNSRSPANEGARGGKRPAGRDEGTRAGQHGAGNGSASTGGSAAVAAAPRGQGSSPVAVPSALPAGPGETAWREGLRGAVTSVTSAYGSQVQSAQAQAARAIAAAAATGAGFQSFGVPVRDGRNDGAHMHQSVFAHRREVPSWHAQYMAEQAMQRDQRVLGRLFSDGGADGQRRRRRSRGQGRQAQYDAAGGARAVEQVSDAYDSSSDAYAGWSSDDSGAMLLSEQSAASRYYNEGAYGNASSGQSGSRSAAVSGEESDDGDRGVTGANAPGPLGGAMAGRAIGEGAAMRRVMYQEAARARQVWLDAQRAGLVQSGDVIGRQGSRRRGQGGHW